MGLMSDPNQHAGGTGVRRGWRATIRCTDWSKVAQLAASHSSRGELWLGMPHPPAPGTLVELKVVLPDGTAFVARGIVRYTVSEETARASGARPGMRVQLEPGQAREFSLLSQVAATSHTDENGAVDGRARDPELPSSAREPMSRDLTRPSPVPSRVLARRAGAVPVPGVRDADGTV